MRVIWGLVIVCLVAATGLTAARAGEAGELGDRAAHSRLDEPPPALPAVTATRHAPPLVASRPSGTEPRLPPGVVPAAPDPALITASVARDGERRCDHLASRSISARSARGPPAR